MEEVVTFTFSRSEFFFPSFSKISHLIAAKAKHERP